MSERLAFLFVWKRFESPLHYQDQNVGPGSTITNQPWCYAAPCRWFLHGGGSSCWPVHPGQNHPRLARGEVPDAAEQAVPHLQPRSVCSSPGLLTPVKTQCFSLSTLQMFFHPSNTASVHVPVTYLSFAVSLSFYPNVIALKPQSLHWQTLFGSRASPLSGKKKIKNYVLSQRFQGWSPASDLKQFQRFHSRMQPAVSLSSHCDEKRESSFCRVPTCWRDLCGCCVCSTLVRSRANAPPVFGFASDSLWQRTVKTLRSTAGSDLYGYWSPLRH